MVRNLCACDAGHRSHLHTQGERVRRVQKDRQKGQKGSAIRGRATAVDQNPDRQTDRQTDRQVMTQGCRQSRSVGSRTSTLERSDLHEAPRDREPGDKPARSPGGGESHA